MRILTSRFYLPTHIDIYYYVPLFMYNKSNVSYDYVPESHKVTFLCKKLNHLLHKAAYSCLVPILDRPNPCILHGSTQDNVANPACKSCFIAFWGAIIISGGCDNMSKQISRIIIALLLIVSIMNHNY